MQDTAQPTVPHNSTRVSLSVEREVQYWTQKFGVSHAQLQRAVRAVRSWSKAVEDYLHETRYAPDQKA